MSARETIEQMSVSERSTVRLAVEVDDGLFSVASSQRVIDQLVARGLVDYSPRCGAVLTAEGVAVLQWVEAHNERMRAAAGR